MLYAKNCVFREVKLLCRIAKNSDWVGRSLNICCDVHDKRKLLLIFVVDVTLVGTDVLGGPSDGGTVGFSQPYRKNTTILAFYEGILADSRSAASTPSASAMLYRISNEKATGVFVDSIAAR